MRLLLLSAKSSRPQVSYAGHGFLGLPDLETAKQCILETVTVLEMRKSVTVPDCHFIDVIVTDMHCTVYRPNPNTTLAFSQATCSPAEGTKLRCRRCLSFFVSKIEITRRTYLPSNHRDAAAPAEALGIRLVIQLRIIYTA